MNRSLLPKGLAARVALLICGCLWSASAFAVKARVVYIDPNLRFLVIDKGRFRHLSEGSHVCLLDSKGFIITCSGVVIANRTKAGLRFPKEEMEKIKLGAMVSLKSVYIKADPVLGPKTAPPKFFRAKSRPETLPKTLTKAVVKAEKQLAIKAPPAPVSPPKDPAADASSAGTAAGERTGKGAGKGEGKGEGEGEGEVPPTFAGEGEVGTEVAHDGTKPYPPEVREPNKDEDAGLAAEGAGGEDSAPEGKDEKQAEAKKAKGDEKGKKGDDEKDGEEDTSELADGDSKPKRPPVRYFRSEILIPRPLLSHVAYNNLFFDTIPRGATQRDSLWIGKANDKPPLGGLGLQLKILVRSRWIYAFGWRYWAYAKQSSEERLDLNFPQLLASTETKVESNGFWGEVGRRFRLFPYTGAYLGTGLDLDLSEITLKSMRLTDPAVAGDPALSEREDIVAFATSSLSVLSLRMTGNIHFKIWRIGTSLSLTLFVPFMEARETFESEVAVPENVDLRPDPDQDLRDALNHRKGSFGAEASLSFFVET